MLLEPFNPSFVGWLVSNLDFFSLSSMSLSFVWTKLELSFDAITVD
jgi:hypothetical protein